MKTQDIVITVRIDVENVEFALANALANFRKTLEDIGYVYDNKVPAFVKKNEEDIG